MKIARKIAYNVAVSSGSKVLSTVLALVAIGFITRYLGQEGFGDYAVVLAFLAFFSAISDLGLYSISTREISRPQADVKEIMGNIFTLRLVLSLAVFLISPLIVWFLPYSIEVKYGIVIVAASFVFSSGYQILNGIFQKHLVMDRVAVGELVGKVVQVLVVIWAVAQHLSFLWIIGSLLANMAVSFLIIFIWSRSFVKISLRFDFTYWKKFLWEAFPLGIASIITFFYFKMDTILLSVIKGSAEVGIYNAAYKVLENLTFFPSMVAGLVLPIFSESLETNRERFEMVAQKTFKFFLVVVLPTIVGAMFLSDDVVRLIGGGAFVSSGNVLRILIFALGFIFFGNFFNAILIAGRKQKNLMWALLVAAVVNVSLNLWLIPYFSYWAAAATSVITEGLVVLITAWLSYKYLDYCPKMEKPFRLGLSVLILAGFLYLTSGYAFVLRVLGGIFIYIIASWALNVIQTSELKSLITRKSIEEYEEVA